MLKYRSDTLQGPTGCSSKWIQVSHLMHLCEHLPKDMNQYEKEKHGKSCKMSANPRFRGDHNCVRTKGRIKICFRPTNKQTKRGGEGKMNGLIQEEHGAYKVGEWLDRVNLERAMQCTVREIRTGESTKFASFFEMGKPLVAVMLRHYA